MNEAALRTHLVNVLKGRGAHLDLETGVANIPKSLRGARIQGCPHTPWRLVEHLRIAQWDILEFCRSPQHVSPEFPTGYWPTTDEPTSEGQWDNAVGQFMGDLKAMQGLVTNPSTDLFARIPHGDGQTVLREALLVADHNAYHLGQLMLICRTLEP